MTVLKSTLQDFTKDYELAWNGLKLRACPEKALYLPDAGTLLVSDFHFGKASHFRKSGIAVPDLPEEENLRRLDALVQRLAPKRIVFSGDMFHSRANQSLMRFEAWRKSLPHIEVLLVPGNHDILPLPTYRHLGIDRLPGNWEWEGLSVCHDPADAKPAAGRAFLAGHLHPGYRLRGAGGEAVTLPCLLLGADVGLLPAFGAFTGLYAVRPQPGNALVLFGGGKVYPVGKSLPLSPGPLSPE